MTQSNLLYLLSFRFGGSKAHSPVPRHHPTSSRFAQQRHLKVQRLLVDSMQWVSLIVRTIFETVLVDSAEIAGQLSYLFVQSI